MDIASHSFRRYHSCPTSKEADYFPKRLPFWGMLLYTDRSSGIFRASRKTHEKMNVTPDYDTMYILEGIL